MSLPLLGLLLLLGLGLLLQCGWGLVAALRRPPGVIAGLAVPVGALLYGGVLSAWSAERLYQNALGNLDDPDLPLRMLMERPAIWEGLSWGGLGAALATLPLLAGVAIGALRTPASERSWLPTMVAAFIGFAAPLVLGMGMLEKEFLWEQGLPALALCLLLPPGLLGLAPQKTRALAAMGLMVGLCGLLFGGYAWMQSLPREQLQRDLGALLNLWAPFNLGIVTAAVAVPVGWLAAPGGRSSVRVIGAPLAFVLLGLMISVAPGWLAFRQVQLGRLTGMYELTVAQTAADQSGVSRLPRSEGLPGRILVASAVLPRWLERSPEGLVARRLEGELLDVGPQIRRGDGILLPPSLNIEDFYLLLSGSDAGSIGLVACASVGPVLLRQVARDPLLATGWCGARPLRLRRGLDEGPARSLILLKDAQIDEDGELRSLSDLRLDERPVLVRLQLDAKMSDFLNFLARVPAQANVYLGWGVQLDGTPLPVG
ncbi:MAG TPA: hypothetical protein PLA94_18490, partial [Myxococcota bacterium]|nr:hypothetical protein [Myxococcota bacterium]